MTAAVAVGDADDHYYQGVDDDGGGQQQQQRQRRPPRFHDALLSGLVRSAAELRGLAFGNGVDRLLPQGGLAPRTLTFVYGSSASVVGGMMNVLCGNAVQTFGGRAVFIDASNSFDPYAVVRRCAHQKDSASSERLLQSIVISRAFTCYQLADLVIGQLPKLVATTDERWKEGGEEHAPIRFVAVSGIGGVFNEQDNTATETERLQYLMASSLRRLALDRTNNDLRLVVASSSEASAPFVQKSDVAIKLFGEERAVLMKHYTRQFAEADL